MRTWKVLCAYLYNQFELRCLEGFLDLVFVLINACLEMKRGIELSIVTKFGRKAMEQGKGSKLE
jgi:hypothetical protein